MTHNYSRCPYEVCALCDAYGDGYSRGKDKGVFESALATIHMSTMNLDCQCCSACAAYGLFHCRRMGMIKYRTAHKLTDTRQVVGYR